MAGTVNAMDVGRKRKKSIMGSYFPTTEERAAHDFCIRNNIRISYQPISTGAAPKEWYITVIIGPYKKGEKPNLSPDVYGPGEIQKQIYKASVYYYNKYELNTKTN